MCVLGVGRDKYMCMLGGWGGISTCVCVGEWGWTKHSVDYDE